MNIKYQTIQEVNEHIKQLLENDLFLERIVVRGEVANITNRGHIYMTLKDQKGSTLKAVLFKGYQVPQCYIPNVGDDILLYGSIEVYSQQGIYQLIVKDIMKYGDGMRLIELEKLRKALQSEGIFDESHKLTIPKYPNKIAIITSKSGAAIHDIVKNIMIRYPIVEVELFNAMVQGEEAPKDLLRALNLASNSNADIIILGRGGGDKEDLSAFNDEKLVRAIYDLKIPLISAVGHESDYTLVDYVSDLRASTPTDAAIKATPRINDILLTLDNYHERLKNNISNKILFNQNKVQAIRSMQFFKNPGSYHQKLSESINIYKLKLQNYIKNSLTSHQNAIKDNMIQMHYHLERILKDQNNHVSKLKINLESLNPKRLIDKGYSLTIDENNNIIKSINDVNIQQTLKTILKDGIIESTVTKKE